MKTFLEFISNSGLKDWQFNPETGIASFRYQNNGNLKIGEDITIDGIIYTIIADNNQRLTLKIKNMPSKDNVSNLEPNFAPENLGGHGT